MARSERRMDGEGEQRVSMESSLAAAVDMALDSKDRVTFCFVVSRRGFRFARFSGEKRNALSESFFLGAVGLKRKVFPMTDGLGWGAVAKGPCARWKRASGLGWLVDLGSRGVEGGGGGANGDAAATEMGFGRHSVMLASPGEEAKEGGEAEMRSRRATGTVCLSRRRETERATQAARQRRGRRRARESERVARRALRHTRPGGLRGRPKQTETRRTGKSRFVAASSSSRAGGNDRTGGRLRMPGENAEVC